MLRLNLGSGNMPLPKPWKNIDKYYFPGECELHPDHGKPKDYDWEKGDFRDLSMFKDGSIEKVNMCHSLEHVSLEDARKTLGEVYRVLKPKGQVEIEVPDLEMAFVFDFETMTNLIFGGIDSNTYHLGHFCGFTPQTLMAEMADAGFKIIDKADVGFGTSKPEPDRNFRLRGTK